MPTPATSSLATPPPVTLFPAQPFRARHLATALVLTAALSVSACGSPPPPGSVAQAEDVTGPYDVIVRAEARNVDELGKLVVARIQGVDGITRTLTCPVVHL